jgi:3,4-dihydroxy 2-butanone 4-phosphate synthase/GTP cyclohydrolase II
MRHLLNVRTALSNGHHDPLPARPRVTLSYAQSLDGSITVQRGESTAISGPDSLTMTHQLRAEHDAILVGIGTVLADDPQLTVRLAAGSSPQPVILDSALRFPAGARLLCHPSHAPWIVTTPRADAERQRELEAAGAVVIRVPAGRDGRVDLAALLAELGRRGVETLMVEGGAAVITSFLAARLVDRVVLTVAPIYIGGLNAVEDLVRVNGRLRPQLHNPTYRWAGRDLILSGDVSWVDAVTMDDAGG